MGCASSKQKRCRHCKTPYSPVPRSYSMHVHQNHRHPETEGESYHVVALASNTLGTIKLNSPASNHHLPQKIDANGGGRDFKLSNFKVADSEVESFRFDSCSLIQRFKEKDNEKNEEALEGEKKGEKIKDFSVGLIEAKTWSNMIEEKITKIVPRTPIRTPPGEPETINTWELMEGLEDISPFRSPNHFRSFSFDVNGDVVRVDVDPPKSSVTICSPKPIWLQMTEEESELTPAVSDFDPEVLSSFRKTLQKLSPDSPFHLPQAPSEEKKINGEEAVMDVKVAASKDKVVVYFTSLRGVRKTYEDCCQVRMILKGLGVRIDERDVSMHSGFKEELKELLGEGYGAGGLPRVFVGKSYIGGAEEIQKLHEDGKLEKLLANCVKMEDTGDGDGGGVCEACGDIRFIPCETCYGSCKLYYEGDKDEDEDRDEDEKEEESDDDKDKDDDDDDSGGDEGGFQRCPDCNENGLIRCPNCCY